MTIIYIYIYIYIAQVAAGDDDHDGKWSIFASWWKEKHHQRKLRSVKTILGTSIGAGCSNQMQVAQGQDLHLGGALVLYIYIIVTPLSVLRAEPFILPVHLWTFFVKEKASRRRTGGHSSISQQAT